MKKSVPTIPKISCHIVSCLTSIGLLFLLWKTLFSKRTFTNNCPVYDNSTTDNPKKYHQTVTFLVSECSDSNRYASGFKAEPFCTLAMTKTGEQRVIHVIPNRLNVHDRNFRKQPTTRDHFPSPGSFLSSPSLGLEPNPPLTLTALFEGMRSIREGGRGGGAEEVADYFHNHLPSNIGRRKEKGQFPG
ncbi:hypothetical protein CEXT_669161 [Caerostris extrusa]|uniref:Uncharacterized protein n=1 Tax=Caerostris extrusa TaxID=172846 RepID=A0AAV4SUW2_CAEEX|nr:hypothetical protein CEXT_669161 [Caerostris extrusa]